MKILLTTPSYPPYNSGLGNAVELQATSLARLGHSVVVSTGSAVRSSRIDPNGVRVELFSVSGAASWLSPIKGEQNAYVEFLKEGSWDVIIFNAWQNWATDLGLKHILALAGRKFVYSHCISTNVFFFHQPLRSIVRYLAWRSYWWRLPNLMRKLDGVIFLSDRGCDSRFDDLLQAKRASVPVHVIPNALSAAATLALGAEPMSFSGRDRLVAVGSYQWQKGFDFVLRAYAVSTQRNKVPLHFYGQEHTAYSTELQLQATHLGLDPNYVVFHEGVSGSGLLAEYGRASLVLSGSHTECQPLALLDASACATPFVARATGCIDSMPGGVAVSSWRGMARQIDELCDDSPRWTALSKAARTAASTVYHLDATTRELVKVLGGGL
jgi:1,2-diacylglycerol 3-alpha-glucosyltransferase